MGFLEREAAVDILTEDLNSFLIPELKNTYFLPELSVRSGALAVFLRPLCIRFVSLLTSRDATLDMVSRKMLAGSRARIPTET